MPFANIELHERYPGEVILATEYTVVHQEFGEIGLRQTAAVNGSECRLTRASYYGDNGTAESVLRAAENIKRRLNRKVSVVVADGPAYGFGLEEVLDAKHIFARPFPPAVDRILAGQQIPIPEGFIASFKRGLGNNSTP